MVNRMLYRARQRGFLELDLLIVSLWLCLRNLLLWLLLLLLWLLLLLLLPPLPPLPPLLLQALCDAAGPHTAERLSTLTRVGAHMHACAPSRCVPAVQGMWAERELPRMSSDMVQDLEVVLDQENPYMFKWLTGQVRPPGEEAPPAAQQAHRPGGRLWLCCTVLCTVLQSAPAPLRAAVPELAPRVLPPSSPAAGRGAGGDAAEQGVCGAAGAGEGDAGHAPQRARRGAGGWVVGGGWAPLQMSVDA